MLTAQASALTMNHLAASMCVASSAMPDGTVVFANAVAAISAKNAGGTHDASLSPACSVEVDAAFGPLGRYETLQPKISLYTHNFFTGHGLGTVVFCDGAASGTVTAFCSAESMSFESTTSVCHSRFFVAFCGLEAGASLSLSDATRGCLRVFFFFDIVDFAVCRESTLSASMAVALPCWVAFSLPFLEALAAAAFGPGPASTVASSEHSQHHNTENSGLHTILVRVNIVACACCLLLSAGIIFTREHKRR